MKTRTLLIITSLALLTNAGLIFTEASVFLHNGTLNIIGFIFTAISTAFSFWLALETSKEIDRNQHVDGMTKGKAEATRQRWLKQAKPPDKDTP